MIADHEAAVREEHRREQLATGRLARFFDNGPVELATLVNQPLELGGVGCREHDIGGTDHRALERPQCELARLRLYRRLPRAALLLPRAGDAPGRGRKHL